MVLLLKLRVFSLTMGVFHSSYTMAVGVKSPGLKKVFLIFSDTLPPTASLSFLQPPSA